MAMTSVSTTWQASDSKTLPLTIEANVDVFGSDHLQRNEVFIFIEHQLFHAGAVLRVIAAFAAADLGLASSVYALEVSLGFLSGLVVLLLIGVGEVAEDRIQKIARNIQTSCHL